MISEISLKMSSMAHCAVETGQQFMQVTQDYLSSEAGVKTAFNLGMASLAGAVLYSTRNTRVMKPISDRISRGCSYLRSSIVDAFKLTPAKKGALIGAAIGAMGVWLASRNGLLSSQDALPKPDLYGMIHSSRFLEYKVCLIDPVVNPYIQACNETAIEPSLVRCQQTHFNTTEGEEEIFVISAKLAAFYRKCINYIYDETKAVNSELERVNIDVERYRVGQIFKSKQNLLQMVTEINRALDLKYPSIKLFMDLWFPVNKADIPEEFLRN